MPSRRATALLRTLVVLLVHCTRAMPRVWMAQSMTTRHTRVTTPRPCASGAIQTPISQVPMAVSKLNSWTQPTSLPSSQVPCR